MKKFYSIFSLILIFVLVFASCTPSSVEDCLSKLEKQDYIVTEDHTSVPSLIQAMTKVQCTYIYGFQLNNSGIIHAFYFSSEKDAKQALDYIKEWAGNKMSDASVTIDDEVIYFGNDQGVQDFTK